MVFCCAYNLQIFKNYIGFITMSLFSIVKKKNSIYHVNDLCESQDKVDLQ
jgi:hypothetical protein